MAPLSRGDEPGPFLSASGCENFHVPTPFLSGPHTLGGDVVPYARVKGSGYGLGKTTVRGRAAVWGN